MHKVKMSGLFGANPTDRQIEETLHRYALDTVKENIRKVLKEEEFKLPLAARLIAANEQSTIGTIVE
jgi:hypothetical protein